MSTYVPKPSRFLSLCSTVVILVSLLLLSLFIATIVWQPFYIVAGVFVVPFLVALSIQQYRGTFRKVPSAAKMASILLYVFGGFALLMVVVPLGEAIVEGWSLRRLPWGALVIFLSAGVCCLAFGRMNALWLRKLRALLDSLDAPPVRRGVSRRELLLGAGVVVGMTLVTAQLVRSGPPRCAENIEASAAPFTLPPDAENVCYCYGHRGTIVFEFSTTEPAFRRWVNSGIGSIESESENVTLKEIDSPYTIDRYYSYSTQLNGPDRHTISNGIYYDWSEEDRGVYAVFDRSSSRAYYHAHFH